MNSKNSEKIDAIQIFDTPTGFESAVIAVLLSSISGVPRSLVISHITYRVLICLKVREGTESNLISASHSVPAMLPSCGAVAANITEHANG